MRQTLTLEDKQQRGFKPVAELAEGTFCLWRRPGGTPPWQQYYLERVSGDGRKNAWWLSWNGSRFAGNRDFKILEEYNPGVAQAAGDWLVETA